MVGVIFSVIMKFVVLVFLFLFEIGMVIVIWLGVVVWNLKCLCEWLLFMFGGGVLVVCDMKCMVWLLIFVWF